MSMRRLLQTLVYQTNPELQLQFTGALLQLGVRRSPHAGSSNLGSRAHLNAGLSVTEKNQGTYS